MEACVGCKLCVNSCPVDCINMVPLVKQIVINAKKRRAAKIARIKLQEVAKFVDAETIKKDLKEILAD